jgi:hypothetical protein
VRIGYPRYYRDVRAEDPGDAVETREVEYRFLPEGMDVPSDWTWEAEAPVFGAPGTENTGSAVTQEMGAQIAFNARGVLFALRIDGTQRMVLPCLWDQTRHARVGDQVRVQLSWMPDYTTGKRGLDTYGVIVSIEDSEETLRLLTVETITEADPPEDPPMALVSATATDAPNAPDDGIAPAEYAVDWTVAYPQDGHTVSVYRHNSADTAAGWVLVDDGLALDGGPITDIVPDGYSNVPDGLEPTVAITYRVQVVDASDAVVLTRDTNNVGAIVSEEP